MKAVYALYSSGDAAQRAVDRLHALGVPEHDIAVMSSNPIEGYEFSQRDRSTWLYYIASVGGGVGLCFGAWLARTAQTAWPLPTGGMPILAWWPSLIIMFELMMLGSVIATVITLFVTVKTPGLRLYDADVADGMILIGVKNPRDEAIPVLRSALRPDSEASLKTL
jgi:hypothetical protein